METTKGYYTDLSVGEKFRELTFLLRDNLRKQSSDGFADLLQDIEEYRQLLRRYCGLELGEAQVFEIGFGRRPERLIALMSQASAAAGVDLYAPLLSLAPAELLKVFRVNGFESGVRSLARYLLFDLIRRYRFEQALARHGHHPRVNRNGFLVGDVAKLDVEAGQFDLIVSHGVFQCIPEIDLRALLPKLTRWLKPTGICAIRTDPFTTVWGGLPCNFLRAPGAPSRAEPWEHLRKNRFRSTCYVNGLTRKQYRELYAAYFEIVEEKVKEPNLGKDLLTPEIASELQHYSEEELLSSGLTFVLRQKDRRRRKTP